MTKSLRSLRSARFLDGGYYLPSSGVSAALTLNLAENFMMSETHIFNPNLVNEFRFGYNWGHYVIGQENANHPASTLVPGLGGVPFTGFAGPNGGTRSSYWAERAG